MNGCPKLVRNHIHRKLYAKTSSSFFQQNDVLPREHAQIDVADMWGEAEYRRHVASILKANPDASFVTMPEVFGPAFSNAIGRFVLEHFDENVRVLEVGGGSGVNGMFLKRFLSERAEGFEYACGEISAALAKQQKQRGLDVVEGDFVDTDYESRFGLVYANEVLDNLTHDLVRIGSNGAPTHEAYVGKNCGKLKFRPVKDEMILRLCDLIPPLEWGSHQPPEVRRLSQRIVRYFRANADPAVNSDLVYVPTGALMFLEKCLKLKADVLLSDFNYLPRSPHVPTAHNAPLIASRDVDFDSITTPETCDLFFATNFAAMEALCRKLGFRATSVKSNYDFMNEYGQPERTINPLSRYAPLAEDFANVSWLFARSGPS